MQKTLIIYKSETGFTQKYAKCYQMRFKYKMMMKRLILMLKNKQPEFCEMISKVFRFLYINNINGPLILFSIFTFYFKIDFWSFILVIF